MAKRTSGRSGGPAPRASVANLVRNFQARNIAERRKTPWSTIERQLRQQVQRDHPDLPPAEIEARVARRMEHGRRSTK